MHRDRQFAPESTTRRLFRRIREEPLVPVGMLLTCGALVGAARAMKRQDHVRANTMFRRRIYAQGFTLLCVVVGSTYWRQDREKRKEVEQMEKDKASLMKRERWLAELEARDVEDKVAKERVEKLKERRKQREDAVKARLAEEGDESS